MTELSICCHIFECRFHEIFKNSHGTRNPHHTEMEFNMKLGYIHLFSMDRERKKNVNVTMRLQFIYTYYVVGYFVRAARITQYVIDICTLCSCRYIIVQFKYGFTNSRTIKLSVKSIIFGECLFSLRWSHRVFFLNLFLHLNYSIWFVIEVSFPC